VQAWIDMWNHIDRIAKELESSSDISQWSITGTHNREDQFFSTGTRAEEFRTVDSRIITVEIFHINGRLQGISSFSLQPHQWAESRPHIERACEYVKKLHSNRLYILPSQQRYRKLSLCSAELKDNSRAVIDSLWSRASKASSKFRNGKLSTLELFTRYRERYFKNSRGCAGFYDEGLVFMDCVVTATSGAVETESHGEYSYRSPEQMKVEAYLERHLQQAKDKIHAALPPSGPCAVLIGRESVQALFEPFIYHSSAKAFDMGISVFKQGEQVCTGDRSGGTPLTIVSDPLLEKATQSFPFDKDGVSAKRATVIKNGVFSQMWATAEYADYLKIAPTGEFGNCVVDCGRHPIRNLARGPEKVLRIEEFSHFRPDPASGDFVDEIRLGYLINRGKIKPVKGGSISGNVFRFLGDARFSSEMYSSGKYMGPAAVLFPQITVSGA